MLAWGICFSGTEDFGELWEEFWGVVTISFMFARQIYTILLSTLSGYGTQALHRTFLR
jgi:hypothetical protein